MNKFAALYIFIFACLISCKSVDKAEEGQPAGDIFYAISLEKPLSDALEGMYQTVSLSEVGGYISYIPLELTDKSVFRSINSITLYDSSIFIGDINRMLEFDLSGRFIRQIGRQGKGPREYIYAFELVANDTIRCLRVDSECFMYNREGAFIRSFNIESMDVARMSLMDDKLVFYCLNKPVSASENPYSLFITDLNLRKIKTFRNHHRRKSQSRLVINGLFYSFGGKVRFREWGVDTLYTVTADTIIPYALITMGERALPFDVVVNADNVQKVEAQYSDKMLLYCLLEDNNNFYLKFVHFLTEAPDLYAIYAKHSGYLKMIGESGFRNVLDGGLPFFPRYVFNDSILVDWVDAYDLREKVLNADAAEMHKLYGQKFDDLLKLAKNLNDNSGTVLVMVRP